MSHKTIKIFASGDTVGEPGKEACKAIIPRLIEEKKLDFVIVNGENLAGGSGITEADAREIFNCGVDVITSGDHYFDRKEAQAYLSREPRVLRPANYPTQVWGAGSVIAASRSGVKVGVMNLLGQVFLQPNVDNPFLFAKKEVERMRRETPLLVIDFHAEATSEKIALGWFLDGQVTAIVGSHTHVQTADEKILPQGTAFISDMGMTGPYRSILGRQIDPVLSRFITQVPARFPVAHEDIRLCGVIIEAEIDTGLAVGIERVQERLR